MDESTAFVSAACFGDGDAFFLPFQNVLSLKFIDSSDYLQHQLPGWSGGINVFLVADQMNLPALEQLHDLK